MARSNGFSRARLARMHEILAGHVERGEVPGIVTLVSRRGEVHVDAIGTTAVGGAAPMQRDTIFRIASMTKPIIADAQLLAVRGARREALAALQRAEKAGWRGPLLRYYRDHDANLASIRGTPEFKAVFADIERDMAQQRAGLAARPKEAPLELSSITQ